MLREDMEDLDKHGVKGDWCFLNDDHHIALRYGEDAFKGLVILPISEDVQPGKPDWLWDGNREAPTLSPSILIKPYPDWTEGWHGWLKAGKLITA